MRPNLKRGKVECRISLNRTAPGAATLAVSAERVEHLAQAAADVERHAPGAAPLSVAEILRWPGVLAEPTLAPGSARHARARARRQGARASSRRRAAREGAKLAAALEERCAAIEAQVARVAPRIPALHAAYLDKLGARLKEAGLDPDQERLKQELALFATKIDVAEEVQRLATHVAEVRRVLDGRRQRGQATRLPDAGAPSRGEHAGSKSVDAELSQASLELKVLIEQMREQVQNVE